MSTADLEIAPTTSPQTVVVRIGRALDFLNAGEFETLCNEHVAAGTRQFVLDFSGTGVLGSTGLGAIFALHRTVSPEGGQVIFACVSPPVQEVIKVMHIDQVFSQYPTVQAALLASQ